MTYLRSIFYLSILFSGSLLITSCGNDHATEATTTQLTYPESKKDDVSDDYFGTVVADPYRWLENDTAADVADWVAAQNEVTFGYLDQIGYRGAIKERLSKIWNYPKYGAPFRKGSRYYYYKNDGLQNQSVLYSMEGLDGEGSVFIDPNTLSEDGTTSLGSISWSKDAQYCAYQTSSGGSDWKEIHVMDVNTGELMEDHLKWIKFSGISWYQDGFFYSRYAAPEEGGELSGKNEFHKIYYHKLGTSQDADELIFEDTENAQRNFYAQTTDDERFLIVYASQSTSGNMLYSKDMSDANAEFIQLIDNFDHDVHVVDNVGDNLYIITNIEADNNRLVSVDPNNAGQDNWTTIIPQSDNKMQDVSMVGGKMFVTYMINASNTSYVYDLMGNQQTELALPPFGRIGGFAGSAEDTLTFVTFRSFIYPTTIYQYNVRTDALTMHRESEVDFNPDDYVAKQEWFQSKDGTKVPVFIVHKKDIAMDGTAPTLLYGYGGFNISILPSFSVSNLILLENGGVYAVATLRGGGEFGEQWHKDGMLLNKQNVFDDFIGAGEYLIEKGYTSKDKLAIYGRSNGGLLVGACMTQRPDLFKVAFPAVGVMDMLRYHQFTIGWAWAGEYGRSDSAEHFPNLYSFSPVHNVKPETAYPATMVTTADHDDRVVPAHSFKFIATLQEHHAGDAPVLIRIDTKAGHGAGTPTSKRIEAEADKWSFMFHNMDVTPNYMAN